MTSNFFRLIAMENFAISTFLHTHGIDYRLSCPHTPEQNRVVQRRNRIIVEKGLTLLAQSSLPQTFWEHAFHTAIFLYKSTITPTLAYNSTYQLFTNAAPTMLFLKLLVAFSTRSYDHRFNTNSIFVHFLVFF